jgi:hypothetical protein
MAKMTVNAVPSNTNITVQDSNNIIANISGGNEVNVQVTPTPRQTIQINRGVKGADGGDNIGGYPVVITAVQPQDVIMFGTNEWVNTPQTEIADGGNF